MAAVASIIIGARTEEQLRQNLGAVGRNLTPSKWESWMRRALGRWLIPTGIKDSSRKEIHRRFERLFLRRAGWRALDYLRRL